jgi:protein-tyrosine phosphatase
MLSAARAAGVTSIVCTPHCRDPYFDFEAMWDAYDLLCANTDFPLQMGFEVNHAKLMDLGPNWIEYLHFDGSNEFLLELSSHATETEFAAYERTIFDLQGKGYEVIIAHPERCHAIQKDPELALSLKRMGCRLQASAEYVDGGRLGRERKAAKHLFELGLYDCIASDAHHVGHYDALRRAIQQDQARINSSLR